jgi:hypothetical protein
MVDNVPGPRFDEIAAVIPYVDRRLYVSTATSTATRQVLFSRDGSRCAYLGRQGAEWVVIADGKEVLRTTVTNPSTTEAHLDFCGDDGKHLMFSYAIYGGYELWVDGRKLPGAYTSGGGGTEGTVDPLFSRDGTHYAYVAQIDRDKRTVILDGRDAGYLADNLQFAAKGEHLFSIIRQPPPAVSLALDGKPIIKADGISHLFMSSAGNAFVAVLQKANPRGEFLVINGKGIQGTEFPGIARVVISPDGKHFAALAVVSSSIQLVWADGKKGQQYDNITADSLQYSADSSKLGYIAHSANKFFVVVNEDESDAFDSTPSFTFSPDGKRVVMTGMQNTRNSQAPGGFVSAFPAFIDGKVERVARSVDLETFQFSPDNSRYGYLDGNLIPNLGHEVYIDGRDSGVAGKFSFSPDGKHVVCMGFRSSDNKQGLFVDGKFVYESHSGMQVRYWGFTPDNQHLFWVAFEPPKNPATSTGDYVTYLDGKAAFKNDFGDAITTPIDPIQPTSIQREWGPDGVAHVVHKPSPAWLVGADGVLSAYGPVGDVVKHFRVTPSPDTSITAMLAAAK